MSPGAGGPTRVDPRALRRAMGRFTTGVTVVTTGDVDDPHGMTANAFTSVSLDPPLVLVAIGEHTRMHERIAGHGRYGVSVLAGDQEDVCMHFARGRQCPDRVRFDDLAGVPVIGGALVRLACTVHAAHRAGDHTLYVGHVDDVTVREGDPLVFFTGAFRGLEVVREDGLWGF